MTARLLTTEILIRPPGTISEHAVMLPVNVQARDAVLLGRDFNLAYQHERIGLVFGLPVDDHRPVAPRRYCIMTDLQQIDGGRWRHIRSLVDHDGSVLHVLEEATP